MKINAINLSISRQLYQTSRSIQQTLLRLTSGSRLSPTDNSASYFGLQGLDAQIRGLHQASLNLNQQKSLLESASNGISSLIEIIQRMRDLSVRAASPSLSPSERKNLQTEILSLRFQYDSIMKETEFNGTKLLNGSAKNLNFQLGYHEFDVLNLDLPDLSANKIFTKKIPTGSFRHENTYNLTAPGSKVAVADLNNDGHLDFIQTVTSGSFIRVGLGDGNGNFKMQASITDAAVNHLDIDVGDFNNDGNIDFATADRDDDTVSVYFGNGDGTFQSRITFADLDRTLAVKVADVNNDGLDDLLSYAQVSSASDLVLSVRLSNGDGSFQNPQTYTANGSLATTRDFNVSDLNNDGFMDLVLASGSNLGAHTIYSVYLNNGDGSFSLNGTFHRTDANGSKIILEDLDMMEI